MKRIVWIGIACLAIVGAGVFWWVQRSQGPQASSGTTEKVYVALGDSVAAGLGLQTARDASACDRTEEGYPPILSSRGGYQLNSLACSGAGVVNGLNGTQLVNELALTPQLTEAIALNPQLITITIGANDVGWTEFLAECYRATCGTELDSTVDARLVTLRGELMTVLETLKSSSARDAATYVTGYYQLFSANGVVCQDTAGVEPAEQRWVNQKLTDLNSVIEETVIAADFGTYVSIDFSGHELCRADSWVQGLNSAAAYHPTASGQRAITDIIEKAMEDL